MTELEKFAHMVTEAIANTAEHCAKRLEDSHNPMSGAQALRNFAAAIRATNTEHEAATNNSVH